MSSPQNNLDLDVLVSALSQFPIHEPPSLLYRFYTEPESYDRISEGTLSALVDGKLKLTPPSKFNDPFEMWAGISEEGLTKSAVMRSLLAERGLFRKAIEANNPDVLRDIKGYKSALCEAINTQPEYWYLHLKSCVSAIAGTMGAEIGVSCFTAFSETELNGEYGIHHWAMYGGQHRGFAIAYNGEHEVIRAWSKAKWFFPVEYRDERLLVPLAEFDEWDDTKMWRTFRTWGAMKSRRAWGDEKEWRLLCAIGASLPDGVLTREENSDEIRYFLNLWGDAKNLEEKCVRASIISRVLLGARASQSLEDAVVEAVKAPHLKHAEIWKVAPCDRDFRLVAHRIK